MGQSHICHHLPRDQGHPSTLPHTSPCSSADTYASTLEAKHGLQMSLMNDVTYVVKVAEAQMLFGALPATSKVWALESTSARPRPTNQMVEEPKEHIGYAEEGIVLDTTKSVLQL